GSSWKPVQRVPGSQYLYKVLIMKARMEDSLAFIARHGRLASRLRKRKSLTGYAVATVAGAFLFACVLRSCAAPKTQPQAETTELEADLSPAARCALRCAATVIGKADAAANQTADLTKLTLGRLTKASAAAKSKSAAVADELKEEAARASRWVASSRLARASERRAQEMCEGLVAACGCVGRKAQAAKCRAMCCYASGAHALAGAMESMAESAEKVQGVAQVSRCDRHIQYRLSQYRSSV
ncbi:unnamed protein product, partial [Effrenium voratum]